MGASAGDAITSGTDNTAIGHSALSALTTNHNNVAVGRSALAVCTASNNVAVGKNCGAAIVGGDKNSGLGHYAMQACTTGVKNTAVGYQAGYNITTGQNNVCIGHNAGFSITTGEGNTLIGDYTRGSASTDHQIVIGHNIDAGDTNYKVAIYNGQVNANFTGSASSWTFSSDGRDKTDVVDLDLGLDFIKKIQPRKFKWNIRKDNKHTRAADGTLKAGFIAQELQSVLSDYDAAYTKIVNDDDPDHLTVGQSDLIPMMINAIKELSAKNDALAAEIASLKSQINN